MRFIRVLFIVLTLPTMSFGQEKTIRYRIDYLMRQDAVTSLYKIEVVNKSDNTTYVTWYDNDEHFFRYEQDEKKIISHHLFRRVGDFSLGQFMIDTFDKPIDLRNTFDIMLSTKEIEPHESFTYYVFCRDEVIDEVMKRIIIVDKQAVKACLGFNIWKSLLYTKSECILADDIIPLR